MQNVEICSLAGILILMNDDDDDAAADDDDYDKLFLWYG